MSVSVKELLDLARAHPVAAAVAALVAFVGVAHSIVLLESLLHMFADLLLPSRGLAKYRAKGTQARTWAIVTGPTAGIGEQFAVQLAQAGFNVGLVGRSKTKLDAVADNLAQYKVEVAHFVLDAEGALPSDFANLGKWAAALGGAGVSVLVNNVGVSHEMPVPFSETTREELRRIIGINNVATLEITHAVLPALKASAGHGRRSLILTMGSFAGLMPAPLLATYAGSKGFLQAWNTALAAELEPEGVDAQLVLSYLVTSAMSKIRRTSALIPDPRGFVAAALRGVGRRGGAQERAFTSTPYWSHALMHWFVNFTPGVWSATVARVNRKMHVDIRRRALRKLKKSE